MNRKEIRHQELILEVELYKVGKDHTKEYDVYLIEGSWPDAESLLTLVDGGDPGRPITEQMYTGGEVELIDNNHAFVRVFQ